MTVMVDPYLSDSVAQTLDSAKRRRIPADESIFDIQPDVIIITHDHLDHLDPDTLKVYLDREGSYVTVLAPDGAYNKLGELGYHSKHNCVLLAPHSV